MSKNGYFVLEYDRRQTWQKKPITRERSYKVEHFLTTLKSRDLEEARKEAMAIVEHEISVANRWNLDHMKTEELIESLTVEIKQRSEERRMDCLVQVGPFKFYWREPDIVLHDFHGHQETKKQLASASP